LVGRLATLNRQLDDLLARTPASQAPIATAEAAARREAPPTGTDTEAISLLQQALLVNDRQRNVILENLANVNTTGFKKRQLVVSTTPHPDSGLQLPAVAAIETIWTMGTLASTERSLDIAIDPEGRVSSRTARAPDVSVSLGQLTLSRFVNPSGLVAASNGVMRPTDASGPPITGAPGSNGRGLLKQGFVECSNVQVVKELINLQLAERQRTMLRRVLAEYGIFVR